MPTPTPAASPSAYARARPALAALKSLALPGLGQWHNGEINKAAWCFLAFAFLSVPGVALVALHLPPALTAPALAVGLLLALGLWIGSAVEAWRTARRAALPGGLAACGGGAAGGTPVWRMNGVTVLIIVLCDFIALPLLIGTVRAQQVQPFRIPSASMTPTLWPGDFVFADMRYGCIACRQPVRRGDVAIFAYPDDRTLLYVKRVVALPGDRVQVDGNAVRVNGVAVPEAQGAAPPPAAPAAPPAAAAASVPPAMPAAFDITVPPGHIFALGDHRSASADSRQFGTVPLQDVVGRVRQVWFSWGEGGVRWSRLGLRVQ